MAADCVSNQEVSRAASSSQDFGSQYVSNTT